MTSPAQSGPTLGELALDDLAAQLGATAKSLAVLRAQYNQLASFVQENAEKLGLSKVDEEGNSVESSAEVNGVSPKTE